MQLIVFSKSFKDDAIPELIQRAHDWGFEGYDLAVRPGFVVDPDNVAKKLPQLVKAFEAEGLKLPMITGNFDLLSPSHETAEPILGAMAESGVGLLKLGYWKYNPAKAERDYWSEVDRHRRTLGRWERVARKHGVKICYHTHSNYCIGLNCAALMHLLRGFDPECIGAYVDTGHMLVEGEAFDLGVAMVRDYLSVVAVKDVLPSREQSNDHGKVKKAWTEAGQGAVDWTFVFETLAGIRFDGPISIHVEYKKPSRKEFLDAAQREVAFFRAKRDAVLAAT